MKADDATTYDVLGVNVGRVNIERACQTLEKWIALREKNYVCIAPVATIVDAQRDSRYRAIVNQAGLVTPDGMPLVWIAKRRGLKDVSRTYGPDLMAAFCALSRVKGYRHYFYGGTDDTNKKLVAALTARYPGLTVAGAYAPPFRAVGEKEDAAVIDSINRARPDIVWVGLGSPKQDYWISDHRAVLNAPVLVGIGAAFDFFAGVKKQAPRWMQRSGLEWLFRLTQEPRRLWKRYLVGNTFFLICLLKDTFRQRPRERKT